MDPGDELVEIVDEDDRVVNIVPRRGLRERRLLHRSTYVVVLNPAGSVYVHRRTETKDLYARFFDPTAGGVNAVGEDYDECAARELEEELGISAAPTFRFKHRYSDADGEVWGAVYDVVWDGPIVWQPSEVVWGAYVRADALDAMIERERFCPDGLEVFERWRGGTLDP
ncbi:MAG: NUDIX domain-containing protein [Actinobacteria bacterium]|nr:NUDIX domain-containing protein [Actinomycetota bacterium]